MESPPHWTVLAHVLRPQGRRGEVLAELLTDFPERFDDHPNVWLAAPGLADEATSDSSHFKPAEVTSYFLPVGRNAGRIVLQLAGVDTIEKAELIAGKELVVPVTERVALESGAAYISDLVGCVVYDYGRPLGVIESVEFPSTPDGSRRLEEAAPLLVILSQDGEEILVPFAKAFLRDLDVAAKSVRMELPEGLSEINRTQASATGQE